ncbi:GntR family transcriptional regulator [Pseudonocardia sp. MH-G8]|uniref:GntR family transcriptional regulator n=1 Tax=Pseudonocardia sp. MH-G8 TaxID=1854588 RepID=UPI000BA06B4A|nr:GntR family transcriptional regulator [Pseudonocardia sp. MH-G8]OZM83175.1 GntR family transcriptional regulator [Pseudonocardia sp. MH-G8]
MTDPQRRPAGEDGARRSVAPRVSRPTFSSQIRDGLLERITSGEYAPGERLVETRIAAEFGTSQAPVREALRDLEALGLIESRPRLGSTVVPFAEQTLREAYVVRAALEEAATRLCMLRGAVPRSAMEKAITEMHRSAEAGDPALMSTSSAAFHRAVVEASENRLLIRAWEALQIEARTSIALMVLEPDLATVADEHRLLLQDMLDGDVERACRHARDHQLEYAQLPHRR